jgi:hypothetical protein
LCGLCNAIIPDKAEFCTHCGATRNFARPAHCPNCNIRLIGVGNFCTGCGQLLYKFCGTCGTRQMAGWIHCPICNRPADSQDDPAAMIEGEVPSTAIPAVGGATPDALAEILNQEAATAFEREQYGDAEQLFRRAAELDPEEPLYLTNLAAVLGELNREAEAEQALQRALELDPEEPATLLAAGVFAADRDRTEDATYYWMQLLKIAPDSEEADEARANLQDLGVEI